MEAAPTTVIKCPYCNKEHDILELKMQLASVIYSVVGSAVGTVYGDPINATSRWFNLLRTRIAKVVPFAFVKKMNQKETASFDKALIEANAWIDMKCPNCGKTYQYNTRLRETRQ